MLLPLFGLLGFELLGEFMRSALHIPVPGPVLGMFLFAAWLAASRYGRKIVPQPTGLDRAAGVLLDNLGLLFVPAGVGILAEADLLRQEWLPILGAVIGSTILSLAATAFVMHRLGRESAPALSVAAGPGGTACIAKS
jgi:putative effector of murein hydrolase LrgA (UPF0299 family)